jgi:hypothetical protein
MKFDYRSVMVAAKQTLSDFGQTVVLVIPTTGAYNPATSSSTVSEATEDRQAALFDFDRINFGQTLGDGTLIQAGDRRCLMDADGAVPTTFCFVEVAGERYPILDIKMVNPAGTPVLYDMLLRK